MLRESLDWTLIRSFLAVAEHKSLSAAARSLGLTQPTLGRHVSALEVALGTRLFTRSVHGLIATDAALDLVPHARDMAATAAALQRAASGELADDRGTVRITASDVIGAEVLPAILARARARHQGIAFELVLSNRNENLLVREADIAVRMVRPVQQQSHRAAHRRRADPALRASNHMRNGAACRRRRRSLASRRHRLRRRAARLDGLRGQGLPYARDAFALRTDNDLGADRVAARGRRHRRMQRQLAARERGRLARAPPAPFACRSRCGSSCTRTCARAGG